MIFQKDLSSIVKVILLALLVVLVGSLVNGLFGLLGSSPAKGVDLAGIIEKTNLNAEQISEALSGQREMAEALKANNMFAPPPPKPGPPKVTGVLGQEALIGGQWKKVGDEVNGAKIVAISPMLVVIEWEGKELELVPGSNGSGPRQEKPKVSKKPASSDKKEVAKPNEEAPVVSKVVQGEVDDLNWLDIPADLKEKFRELWNSMTDEQKEEAKEQWSQMSQEEKDQAIEAWEQHL